MADPRREGRDLVLAAGQFAHVLDLTKGHVTVFVGPSKTSMSETDQPVRFDPASGDYERCDMQAAVQPNVVANEGSYVVLTNPAKDRAKEHPNENAANALIPLDLGKKVNVRGPASFALWYQQTAKVIPGHLMRSNQFLVIQVVNDEAAKANWAQAVIKRQSAPEKPVMGDPAAGTPPAASDQTPKADENKPPANLSMGQCFVIKGTEVSFYIPPTGIEVVPDKTGAYVRDAVSLEQLQYCILLAESGEKRFVQGPAVVFPSPTETFYEVEGQRAFRAIELNPHSGIYVKVIAAYSEGEGDAKVTHQVGKELFITGKDQAIYFPRPEHSIIKYGDQTIHFAVAVPAGEGRYVLNRDSGDVKLVRGPAMLLPDPRTEVIVRRILDRKQAELWYPGNARVVQVNEELMAAAQESGTASMRAVTSRSRGGMDALKTSLVAFSPAEEFDRRTSFTPPRTVTLDNKFEGAVELNIWNGYAVLVVSKTGKRQVVQGPATRLLDFDETLMPIEFSTGTPKMADRPIRTVYLRTLNNRVSDKVLAETSDLVSVAITLSYRVNFEGDSSKWFDVENYIQFMCDHTRSLIRNMVKRHGIEAFHGNAIDLIRDTILGAVQPGKERTGRPFKENGMRIYDVEVLDVSIGDQSISSLLVGAQHETVQRKLQVQRDRQNLEVTKEQQKLARERIQEEATTRLQELELKLKQVNAETALSLAQAGKDIQVNEAREKARLALQQVLDEIVDSELRRQKAQTEFDLETAEKKAGLVIKSEAAAAKAIAEKAKGFSPQLIAALQSFADKNLAVQVATAMAPLAILRDKSVADAFVDMVKGTKLETVIGGIFEHLRPKAQ